MTAQAGPPNQKQLSLVAGANVTLSQSASGGSQTITIIGGGTGATGTGVNFSAGTQSVGSGTLVLANSNSISFGMAGSSQITASINFPAFASQSLGASNLGNLSGTSGMASGSAAQMVFVGGNNITLSQSLTGASGSISIIGTQTVQTQNRFNLTISGNTSGALAAISSGTLTLVGGNNITLSQAGNVITISAPTPGGLQTGVSAVIAGTTSASSGTISFANSNGISFGLNGQTITASVVGGNQASLSGNTAGVLALISSGTMILAGGNNITLSQNGNSITFSAPNTAVQTVQTQSNIQAVIPMGNTIGTTGIIQTGSLGLSAGNNITISQSSGANSTNLVIIGGAGVPSVGGIGNTSGVFTTGGGSLILSGGNNVTLSGITAAGGMTVGISVPATASQTVQTQNLFALQASTAVGGSTAGTTAMVSSGTLTLAAGANITFSQSGGNAITIIGGAGGTATNQAAIAVTYDAAMAGASTSGTTALMTGTVTIAAGRNITISQAGGNAITISAPAVASQVIGVSNLGNTLGTSGVASRSAVRAVFVGGNNITISQSLDAGGASATMTISGPSFATNSMFVPTPAGVTTYAQYGQSSIHIEPIQVQNFLSVSRAEVVLSGSISTSSNSSFAATLSFAMGIYTRSDSTLSLASSGSRLILFTDTAGASSSLLSGAKMFSCPVDFNATPGDYWVGYLSQTASANANWISISNQMYNNGQLAGGPFGATSNTSRGSVLGMGHWTAVSAAMPSSIAFSDIIFTAANDVRRIAVAFVNMTA